jgi:hypothetical protein
VIIVTVVWTVFMMFWLFFGTWFGYDKARPISLGNTIIPWACVLILGLVVFGFFRSL